MLMWVGMLVLSQVLQTGYNWYGSHRSGCADTQAGRPCPNLLTLSAVQQNQQHIPASRSLEHSLSSSSVSLFTCLCV